VATDASQKITIENLFTLVSKDVISTSSARSLEDILASASNTLATLQESNAALEDRQSDDEAIDLSAASSVHTYKAEQKYTLSTHSPASEHPAEFRDGVQPLNISEAVNMITTIMHDISMPSVLPVLPSPTPFVVDSPGTIASMEKPEIITEPASSDIVSQSNARTAIEEEANFSADYIGEETMPRENRQTEKGYDKESKYATEKEDAETDNNDDDEEEKEEENDEKEDDDKVEESEDENEKEEEDCGEGVMGLEDEFDEEAESADVNDVEFVSELCDSHDGANMSEVLLASVSRLLRDKEHRITLQVGLKLFAPHSPLLQLVGFARDFDANNLSKAETELGAFVLALEELFNVGSFGEGAEQSCLTDVVSIWKIAVEYVNYVIERTWDPSLSVVVLSSASMNSQSSADLLRPLTLLDFTVVAAHSPNINTIFEDIVPKLSPNAYINASLIRLIARCGFLSSRFSSLPRRLLQRQLDAMDGPAAAASVAAASEDLQRKYRGLQAILSLNTEHLEHVTADDVPLWARRLKLLAAGEGAESWRALLSSFRLVLDEAVSPTASLPNFAASLVFSSSQEQKDLVVAVDRWFAMPLQYPAVHSVFREADAEANRLELELNAATSPIGDASPVDDTDDRTHRRPLKEGSKLVGVLSDIRHSTREFNNSFLSQFRHERIIFWQVRGAF
jgi:hypothetical protein